MTTRTELSSNTDLEFFSVSPDIDLAVDEDNRITLVRRTHWGTSDERLVIGPLSQTLIEDLKGALDKLRPFARP